MRRDCLCLTFSFSRVPAARCALFRLQKFVVHREGLGGAGKTFLVTGLTGAWYESLPCPRVAAPSVTALAISGRGLCAGRQYWLITVRMCGLFYGQLVELGIPDLYR